jgi:integrase
MLKGMLKQAVEWDYLRTNPAQPVKAPKRRHHEMGFLTPAEIPALLDALSPEWRPLFFTAIFTGMRLGELLALQWSDIDWRGGTVRVRRSVWKGSFQEPKTHNSVARCTVESTRSCVLHPGWRLHRPSQPAAPRVRTRATSGGAPQDAHSRSAAYVRVAAHQSGREPEVRTTAARPRFNHDDRRPLRPPHAGRSRRRKQETRRDRVRTRTRGIRLQTAYKLPRERNRPESFKPRTCEYAGRGDRI